MLNVSFIPDLACFIRKILVRLWPIPAVFLLMVLLSGLAGSGFPDHRDGWVIRAWLPVFPLCLALVFFRLQLEGSVFALIVASLACVVHGGLVLWHAVPVLLLPILPATLWDVPGFLERVNGIHLFHASASLVAGLLTLFQAFRVLASPQNTTTHGSARLATFAEMGALNRKAGIPLGLMPSSMAVQDPLKMASSLKRQRGGKVFFADPAHTVVIAPSGSGKGVGYVVPTLLEYDGPVLVTDIKGENHAMTARHRRSMGRKVMVFDPFSITDTPSVRINFLDSVIAGSENATQDAASLASLIVPANESGSDSERYFASQAASLIQCLVLYVRHDETRKDSERHLGAVYDLLNYPDMGELFQILEKSPHMAEGVVARLARGFRSTDSREFSGIVNTARIQLRFMDSKAMRSCTGQTTMDWDDLVAGEMDLYICIPSEHLDTQFRLIRLLLSLVFQRLEQARGRRSPKNLLMVLDEMPALGYMRKLEQILVYGRGYGVTLMVFAQTVELLASTYPRTWQTFLSSNITVFFDASEPRSAEFIATRLGKTTTAQTSVNSGKSRQKSAHGAFSEQEGTTISHTSRPLLSPDEIMCLGDQVSLVFLRGNRPLMLKKPDYRIHARWKGKYDANPLHRDPEMAFPA